MKLHLFSRSSELLDALRPALSQVRAATLGSGTGLPRPVPVLVPSAQLGDWLQVRLARDLGLSMGFEFMQPAAYFGRHFAAGAAATDFANASAFWHPDRLRWQLLPVLDGFVRHLGQDTTRPLAPRDRFAFAGLLARQLDRYARFRPDWPDRWAGNEAAWRPDDSPSGVVAATDEAWQRELWRRIALQPKAPLHPAQLLRKLAATRTAGLGSPVFMVGTDLLDPLLLHTLDALSRQGQTVSLYLLLPSLGYLGDVSRRHAASVEVAGNPELASENGGHPLLASLGQQAVGTFLLLESISPDYAPWPDAWTADEPPAGATLLQVLQSDIRHQRPPPPLPVTANEFDFRPGLDAADRSLRIHCCHSPRRELEVLRDELLRAFAEIPGLQPEDVMIAVTDFDTYAPLAEGILRAGPHPLPVRLTAVPAREANPVAVGLLALLRLSLGRYSASELIELLNLSAVQHHLDLAGESEALSHLAAAIRQSGLTHGLGANGGEKDASGTWRVALDRHLAGAWLGPVTAARDAGGDFVHPLAPDLHHYDEVLLRFAGWLTQLARHLDLWREPVPAADWAGRLEEAVDHLLHSEAHDDHAAALRRLLGELAGVTASTPLDAGTMLDWLQPQLDNATSLRTSMGGEILLGRLDQIHGLPNRVLAILGLQDGAFPRAARRPGWDLLAHQSKRWDGDPRTQDRQWFLDALLTPADRLILCAANRSLRTPHDGPLSACVEELLRVAADTVRPAEGDKTVESRMVVHHRIQPFATEYFARGSLLPPSYDAGAARIAGDIAAAVTAEPSPFFTAAPAAAPPDPNEPRALTFAQLAAFWRDPAHAWLRAIHLDITRDDADDTTLDDAPLTLDGLQAYAVRTAALASRTNADIEAKVVGPRLVADRALPPGALGTLAWERYDREIEPMARELAPILPKTERRDIDLALAGNVRLTGQVLVTGANSDQMLLAYRVGKYENNPRQQLEAFVQMLAATVQFGGADGCLVLGLDLPKPKKLPAIGPDQARRCLDTLVEGYWLGQRRPLCFAPTASHALAKELAKGKDEAAALEEAKATWNRESYEDRPGGEGTGPAAFLAWRDQDPFASPHDQEWIRWARDVANPLSDWWTGSVGQGKSTPVIKSTLPRKAEVGHA